MLVYKYVHPDRIDVLENCAIRYTQASALNDPFDTYPCLSTFKDSMLDRAQNKLDSIFGVSKADYEIVRTGTPQLVESKIEKMRRNFLNNYPVLSLAKKRDNSLMWSHYAASHRGFVIGFDAAHSYFNSRPPRDISVLTEVKYLTKRAMLPRVEAYDEKTAQLIFFTKSYHWTYEEELRMIARPEAAYKRLRDGNGNAVYLYKFPAEILKEIVMGYSMPKENKKRLEELVTEQYPHVELYEATLNATNFDLDMNPYSN